MGSTPPTLIEAFSGEVPLAIENADPRNWEWVNRSRAAWKLASEDWQDLKAKWYGVTTGSHCELLVNPDSPSLSLEPLASYHTRSMISILVRKSYVTMFDHVWASAMAWGDGAIITGQFGIGKTLFQYYLLVRLLQMKQIVLFNVDMGGLCLFYHDHVYSASKSVLRGIRYNGLPTPKSWYISQPELRPPASEPNPFSSRVFIWSLFDIRERKEPDAILFKPPCLPVQTTSPDPAKYQIWDYKQKPMLTGLPLWTRHELAQGLLYQPMYPSLLDALREAYLRPPEHEHDPLNRFPGAHNTLQNRGRDAISSIEDSLECLLDEAIHLVGFSAGDVYQAIFNYENDIRDLRMKVRIGNRSLINAINGFPYSWETYWTIFNYLLAVSPVYPADDWLTVTWMVDFKSEWVANILIPQLLETDDEDIYTEIMCLQQSRLAQAFV